MLLHCSFFGWTRQNLRIDRRNHELFNASKTAISRPHVLPLSSMNKTLHAHGDACKAANGATFMQNFDLWSGKAVQFARRSLTKFTCLYSVFERKHVLLIFILKISLQSLLQEPLLVYNDHKILLATLKKTDIDSLVTSGHDLIVEYYF